jgi:formylglycine-generating enzyme required for sulfatase activity
MQSLRIIDYLSSVARLILVLLILAVIPSSPALAERRLALVMGNAAYGGNNALDNPVNDAKDIAAVLRQVGFEVTEVPNANLRKMKEAIQSFGEKLKQGGVGLFYFSGHGVQYAGENYLIPIGATETITAVGHFQYEAVPAGYVLATMEDAKNAVNIVILDACRDNPFKSLFRGPGSEGLAPMPVPSGSLIAYSTRPGKKALDGSGRNSPYVKYLKQELLKPGVSIQDMLTNVRVAVKKETHKEQEPGYYSELDGPFCFVGPCGQPVAQIAPPATPPSPPPSESKVFRDKLRDGLQGPEMVRIPAGTFLMGSPKGEKDREGDEEQHQVRIKGDFAIGKYEVTVEQFRRFVEAAGYRTEAETGGGCYYWDGKDWKQDPSKTWRKPGFEQSDAHPVVCVSWNDAVAYTEWLSAQTGQRYRLPTEAEWEYAARAGTQTAYYWGNNPDEGCIYANGADQTAKKQFLDWTIMECRDGYVYTAPVDRFQANAWGLHNMLGNVWEWTCSEYKESYGGAEQRCVNKNASGLRVLRGGSWNYPPGWLRAASRYWSVPDYRRDLGGFRLARNL